LTLIIKAYTGEYIFTYTTLLFTIISGLIVTSMLIVQKFDKDNPYIRKLCKGDAAGCNSVLESRASMFLGIISWAEIGLLYFGITLAYLLAGNALGYTTYLQLVAVLTLFALPYTLFSIYYQYRMKQWCLLCLTVQGLLWVQFFIALPVLRGFGTIAVNEVFGFLMTAAAVLSVWLLLKPVVKAYLQRNSLIRELNKFKHDPELFLGILQSQPSMPDVQGSDAIVFGNAAAPYSMVMVTNPFCGPCAEMHKKMGGLLAEFPDKLSMITIFSTNPAEGERTQVAEHMIKLYAERGHEKSLKIFKDWYASENKNAGEWIKMHPSIENDSSKVQQIMQAHADFCHTAQIHETPTLYLNGHLLPEQYTIDDIRFLLKIL
ncbi:MAG: vitamin K epoxide reductase family protein, partial [Chitinophagaceae bacterium]